MPNEFAARVDTGLLRPSNQDAALAFELDRGRAFLAVADGVGGAPSGEVASALALEAAEEVARREDAHPPAILQTALRTANERVVAEAIADRRHFGMATTIVAALVETAPDGAVAWVAHLGDSRAYRYADALERLTGDHSWVEDRVREGKLTPEEAELHPRRNVITRCIGLDDEVELDPVARIDLPPGAVLLLCTDGLHGPVPADAIERALAQRGNAGDLADRLIELALQHGGPDNIGVALWRQPGP